MAADKKVRATTVDIDELLGQSERRRRAYAHAEDVLEAAALIREIRKRANLSQKDLADRIGTDQSHISELERGNGPQGPTFAMLKRIGRACNDPLLVVTEKDLRSLRRELEKTQKRRDELEHEVKRLRALAHEPDNDDVVVADKVMSVTSSKWDLESFLDDESIRKKFKKKIKKEKPEWTHIPPNITQKFFKVLAELPKVRVEWADMTPDITQEFVIVAEELFSATERLRQNLETTKRSKNIKHEEKEFSPLPPHDELAVRAATIDWVASSIMSKYEQR